ncbi:hypothetical protein [Nocardiopsis sp. SBT366]|uniref:hypothetical protein n=1 Tax=Nocardiopsis sp. SBT366 TaxID=1580529 RepID=UPI00066B4B73|nr:hypothetical protein [Nocardiopsis sp. SBT366]
MLRQIKRPLVWLSLLAGALFGAESILHFVSAGTTPWPALLASLCFTVTGVGYMHRFRHDDPSKTSRTGSHRKA